MVKPLLEGFEKFRTDIFSKDKSFFDNLIKRGQKPKIMVISCSDSRVDPAILFGTRPGELFVVRNVANLVPPYEPDDGYHGVSAAIEFAVRDLLVNHIVILGHAHCGGISSLCEHYKERSFDKKKKKKKPSREFLNSWIDIAKPALKNIDFSVSSIETQIQAEQGSIINSLNNLMTFPWVFDEIGKNNLKLHGWWFNMENASLWSKNEGKDIFYRIVP